MTTYDEILNGKIRPLNITQDLNQVADLIELSFVGTIDEEGNDYIRYLRRMAQDAQTMYWGLGGIQRSYAPLQGFVYTVDEKIVGNLSLLPFHKSGEFIYLIANVAVRPEFRRKGIARQLTKQAIQYALSKSARSAWLQVRDDNPNAIDLYIQMGFQERCRRTTWTLYPKKLKTWNTDDSLSFKTTSSEDWTNHQKLLTDVYPENVRWNLGFRLNHFDPGIMSKISRFFNGQYIKNFVVEKDHQCLGYITYERTNLFSDSLWMACDERNDERVLTAFYQRYLKKTDLLKPLSINLPLGRAQKILETIGFVKNHTLIWMEESTIDSNFKVN
jgi:ribosomal protein S18 acetylase RimI-like enzyme